MTKEDPHLVQALQKYPEYWIKEIDIQGIEKIRVKRLNSGGLVSEAMDKAIEIAEKNQQDTVAKGQADREEIALYLAGEANKIAKRSNKTSEQANLYSVFAVVISIFTVLISVWIAFTPK